jgi:hypothetical protein
MGRPFPSSNACLRWGEMGPGNVLVRHVFTPLTSKRFVRCKIYILGGGGGGGGGVSTDCGDCRRPFFFFFNRRLRRLSSVRPFFFFSTDD